MLAPAAAKAAVNFEPVLDSSGNVASVVFEIYISTDVGVQNIVLRADEIDLSVDANGDFVRKSQIVNEAARRYKELLKNIRDDEKARRDKRTAIEAAKSKIKFSISEDDFKEIKALGSPRP